MATRILVLCITLLLPLRLASQGMGSIPPGIKWYQLNTKDLRVIYPEGTEALAQRSANLILYQNENNRTSIGPKKKKLDLVLNNQGVLSNGYVATMPYRSEFFTTPPQDGNMLGTNDWIDLLSIHEYRHALQYINLRRGINQIAYYLTGEAGWGLFMNLAVPGWFFEGDAVATETALTTQGRGRIPYFMSQYRSILLDGPGVSYMQACNGSYSEYIPDHYTLGYLLCSYGRETYGNDFWNNVLRRTAWYRGFFYPFSDAVLKYTGRMTWGFYKEAMSSYREKWRQEDSLLTITPSRKISRDQKTVTDYRFPVVLENGDLLVHRESYNQTGRIVQVVNDSIEKTICETGIVFDPYFSARGSLIAWAEISWDPRFSARNYSDIVLYNRETKTKKYLTKKSRFFSPDISPDGTRLVVVEADLLNQYKINILDTETGAVILTLPNPENVYYTYPKWSADGKSLYSSIRGKAGNMRIIRQDLASGQITTLLGDQNHVIGELLPAGNELIYSASYSGINNIFSLDLASGGIRQLTSTRFGAYFPALRNGGNELVYSEFTRQGYQLMAAERNSLSNSLIRPIGLDQMDQFDQAYFEAEGGPILDQIPERNLQPKRYLPFLHAFRLHSWSVTATDQSAGLYLTSDNTLGKLNIAAGGEYYYNEKVPSVNVTATYAGLLPVTTVSLGRTYRESSSGDTTAPMDYDNSASVSFGIPLNYSKGLFWRSAQINVGYSLLDHHRQVVGDPAGIEQGEMLHAISFGAYYNQSKRKAMQNLSTHLGFAGEFTARKAFGHRSGLQVMALADAGIRGIWQNHNLIGTVGIKYERADNTYQFLDQFVYPRGFTIPTTNWMTTIQGTYHFPITYLDWGLAGIFYLYRVRASLFTDMGFASFPSTVTGDPSRLFLSTGVEFTCDTNWLNLIPIPIGVRFSYLATPDFRPDDLSFRAELVVTALRL